MTRILITGAAGFLGNRLARDLVRRGTLNGQAIATLTLADLTACDTCRADNIDVQWLTGDLADPSYADRLAGQGHDTVFHLASLLTLHAEADPELAYAVSGESLRRLVAGAENGTKLIYPSSIAIHGGNLPETVGDDQNPVPATTYGTHKAINELLIADHSRAGRIDGRSLRLPIVLTRPKSVSPTVSDVVAAIIRDPLNGEDVTIPLAPETRVPVASAGTVAAALIRMAEVPKAELPDKRALNLPALSVTLRDLAEAVAGRGGTGRVRFEPDPGLQAVVESWPRAFVSEAAARLGIASDADTEALIDDFLQGAG